MCGRVILTLSAKMIKEILAEEYDFKQLNIDDFMPTYNVGPSQKMLSIIKHDDAYRSGYLNWRFTPSYAKSENEGYKFINARSETVHEKKTYQQAFNKRRCLIVVNGFYEWLREKNKRPFLFHKDQMGLFTIAGIWQPQHRDDGTKEYGLSILTTEANELMKPIHHRMPVIIKPEDADAWLDAQTPYPVLQQMMLPISSDYLSVYEVSSYVNKLSNNDEHCIQPIA